MSQRSLFRTLVYGWVCATCSARFYGEQRATCPACGSDDTSKEAA